MDEQGYFSFSAKAAYVKAVELEDGPKRVCPRKGDEAKKSYIRRGKRIIASETGQEWLILDKHEGGGLNGSFAVVVGTHKASSDPTFGSWDNPYNTLVMLIESHGLARWHNVGYACLKRDWVKGWESQDFRVGGPEPLQR